MPNRLPSLTLFAGATTAMLAALLVMRLAAVPAMPAATLPPLTSHIAVMNPGTGTALVDVTYVGAEGSCAGKTIPHGAGQQTIPVGGVALFDQDPGAASGLAKGCNASAVVSVQRGTALAVVIDGAPDSQGDQTMLAAYRAVGAGEVAPSANVPAWQVGAGAADRTTLVQAMNVGDAADDGVTFVPRDAKGQTITCSSADCRASLASHEAAAWWPPDRKSLADVGPEIGTAQVSAKQPLAVVMSSFPMSTAADSTAANAALPRVDTSGAPRVFPALLRHASGAFAPGVGAGALRLHNLSTTSVDAGADAFPHGGGGAVAMKVPSIGPNLADWLPLADQAALTDGVYAVHVITPMRIDAMARNDWGRALADTTASPTGLTLVVPFVAKQFRDLTSLVLVHNSDEKASVSVTGRLTPSGGGQGLVQSVDIPAGATMTWDMSKDFPNFPSGSYGSLLVVGRGDIAVVGLLTSAGGSPVVAAFEGMPPSAAATELFAPMVHAAWALTANQPPPTAPPTRTPTDTPTSTPTATFARQATDTPTATATPSPTRASPSQVPTDTPTPTAGPTRTPRPSRATPNAKQGWRWPLAPDRLAGVDELPRCVTRAKDGTLWFRVSPPERGLDRVIVVNEARGTVDLYKNLAEAIVARIDQVRRLGRLRCFFVVDRRGRVWVGSRFYDGQAWVDAGRDEPHEVGGMRFDERVILDRNDQAWVPWQGERECLLGVNCRTAGLRLVNEDGSAGGGLMAEAPPEAERYGIPPIDLIEDEPPPMSVGAAARASRPDAMARTWQASVAATDFAVLARSIVKLPDKSYVTLPFLADPVPGTKTIANAGYATASLRDPVSGELWVFTWVEVHQGSGANRSVAPKMYWNRWNGSKWTEEDLSNGPIFADKPAVQNDGLMVDRITAAGATTDGTLWIGTASGRVASWKLDQWDKLYLPYDPAAPGPPIDPSNDPDSPLSGEPISAVTVDESSGKADVCFLSASLAVCQSEGESQLKRPTILVPRVVKNK